MLYLLHVSAGEEKSKRQQYVDIKRCNVLDQIDQVVFSHREKKLVGHCIQNNIDPV